MKNAAIAILIAAAAHAQPTITQRQFRIEELKAPPGLEVTLYATGAGRPRLMAFGPNNVLYAASLEGAVIAIPQQGQVVTVARGLNPAQSVAFRGNDLYVSTNDGVTRFRNAISDDLIVRSAAERLLTLPGGGHDRHTVGFSPDAKMYGRTVGFG